MKKLMTTVLAAALVFAAAGQASAAALETSGEYRGRFWYLDNYSKIPAAQESQDFWDQRLRVKMAWKVSDAVTVNARADVLEYVWDTVTNEANSQAETSSRATPRRKATPPSTGLSPTGASRPARTTSYRRASTRAVSSRTATVRIARWPRTGAAGLPVEFRFL